MLERVVVDDFSLLFIGKVGQWKSFLQDRIPLFAQAIWDGRLTASDKSACVASSPNGKFLSGICPDA